MDLGARLRDAVRLAQSPLPEAFVAAWASAGLLVAPFAWRHRSRLRLALRLGATAVALGIAGALLLEATTEPRLPYKHVDEILADPWPLNNRLLYVHGRIADAQATSDRSVFVLAFDDRDHRQPRAPGALLVAYQGPLPGGFGEGREVIVKGRLKLSDDMASFLAEPYGLIFECPSEDERSVPGAPPPCPR
jgi:cytochrome c-type biogenesis protein CcmE